MNYHQISSNTHLISSAGKQTYMSYINNILKVLFEELIHADSSNFAKHVDLGPVVQSIVSLMRSLRRQLVKYMPGRRRDKVRI